MGNLLERGLGRRCHGTGIVSGSWDLVGSQRAVLAAPRGRGIGDNWVEGVAEGAGRRCHADRLGGGSLRGCVRSIIDRIVGGWLLEWGQVLGVGAVGLGRWRSQGPVIGRGGGALL